MESVRRFSQEHQHFAGGKANSLTLRPSNIACAIPFVSSTRSLSLHHPGKSAIEATTADMQAAMRLASLVKRKQGGESTSDVLLAIRLAVHNASMAPASPHNACSHGSSNSALELITPPNSNSPTSATAAQAAANMFAERAQRGEGRSSLQFELAQTSVLFVPEDSSSNSTTPFTSFRCSQIISSRKLADSSYDFSSMNQPSPAKPQCAVSDWTVHQAIVERLMKLATAPHPESDDRYQPL